MLRPLALLSTTSALLALGAACQNSFESCEEARSCEGADGDGDGDTGGTGGDGDGDTGGNGGAGTGGTADPCDACEGDTPLCNDADECVACLENTDCTETEASLCDAGTCSSCTQDDDCAHLTDTAACDTDAGTCVECTPDTEEEQCGPKSCDPATSACGPHDRASRTTCRSCVSDSDCVANHHCVPMEYPTGTPREGGYCLKLSPGCERPYLVGLSGRTSLSGASGSTYCGINEDLASCEVVRALEDDWRCDADDPGEGQCWPPAGTSADAVEIPGALCRTVGVGADRCTYPCSGASQCDESPNPGSICGPGVDPDPITPDYCGGQDL